MKKYFIIMFLCTVFFSGCESYTHIHSSLPKSRVVVISQPQPSSIIIYKTTPRYYVRPMRRKIPKKGLPIVKYNHSKKPKRKPDSFRRR